MKKLILIAILISAFSSFAAPTITAKNNGDWTSNGTWDLNRIPANGDTILIPLNKTVTITTGLNQGYTFYIKIYGTLSLSGGGSKLQISSASSIFIYPSGAIKSVGSGGSTRLITIGANTIYHGTDPSVAGPQAVVGPQYANNTTGSGFSGFVPLPVKFLGFALARQSNTILVQWSTSEEINVHIYELERSSDGTNWSTIAYISPLGSADINEYSYADKDRAGTNYYRIKEVDVDGKFIYSSIAAAKTQETAANVKIISGGSRVYLQFQEGIKGNVSVRFISLSGQVISEQVINQPIGQVALNLRSNFKGNYIISINNGSGLSVAKQIIL